MIFVVCVFLGPFHFCLFFECPPTPVVCGRGGPLVTNFCKEKESLTLAASARKERRNGMWAFWMRDAMGHTHEQRKRRTNEPQREPDKQTPPPQGGWQASQ